MDFANSVIDIVICAVMPKKILNKYEQKAANNELSKSD